MRRIFPVLLASACIIHPAFAQENTGSADASGAPPAAVAAEPLKPEEKKAEKPALPNFSPIMPVKIKPRQGGADEMSKAAADIEQENNVDPDSLGLLTKISDGAFPPDLWKDYSGEQLSKDLSNLKLDSDSPTLREVLRRALLTTPDAASFADDKSDKEAFSARLNTIMEMGLFDQSIALYKKLEGNIPSSTAAYAGVEALVGKGQMGIACLEEKAVSENFKSGDHAAFWSDLRFLCGNIVASSDAAGATIARSAAEMTKFPAPAKLSELNEKTFIHAYSLSRASDLPASLFTLEETSKLKPKLLALFLTRNDAARIPVVTAAVEKGMLPASELIVAYKTISGVGAATASPLLTIYNKVQAAKDDTARAPLLKEALRLSSAPVPLLPFASSFAAQKDVDSFTDIEAKRVIGLFIRTGTTVKGNWAAKAFANPQWRDVDSVSESDLINALKSAKNLSENDKLEEAGKKSDNDSKTKAGDTETLDIAQLDALSLIFSDNEVEDKTANKSYEKLFNLTPPSNYVMPSMELINGLSEAAQRQDIGKVIVYSLLATDGHRVSQTHPSAFYRIAQGWKSVGLSEEIRSLAHEVLADLIEKKEVRK